LHGVEIYKRQPICYSLGSLIYHTKTPPSHYEPAVWESVVLDCRFQSGTLRALSAYPIMLNEGTPGEQFLQTRGAPRIATGEQGTSILGRFSRLCSALGTEINIVGDHAQIQVFQESEDKK
jgi:poly-gamma-glutamate synthesis protein (capsule biosynthesis protein)